MKNLIKRLIFAFVTSSLLLSSIALGTSASPAVNTSGNKATSTSLYQYLLSFVWDTHPATNASDTKDSVTTVRRIIQLPGLSQHDDHKLYQKGSLCGWYAIYFATKMIRSKDSDFSELTKRTSFDGFYGEDTLQPDLDQSAIERLLKKKGAANASYVALDEKNGVLYPQGQSGLNALNMTKPIGLAINTGGHWIGGMVLIDDAGAKLYIVDSMESDCSTLPVVTTVYDYFDNQIKGMRRIEAQTQAAMLQHYEEEAKRAALALAQQREQQQAQRHRDEEKAAKEAAALAEKLEAEEQAKRTQALADEAAARALFNRFKIEDADAEVARQLQRKQEQEQKDFALAQQLSGCSDSSGAATNTQHHPQRHARHHTKKS